MTVWASPEAVERASRDWTLGQITCRTYGHNWHPLTVTHRPGLYTVRQRCGRCRTERRQEVNEQGYPMTGWNMVYGEGYLLHKVGRVGADGRAVLRLATLEGFDVIEEAAS
jgi:hypothetical protein